MDNGLEPNPMDGVKARILNGPHAGRIGVLGEPRGEGKVQIRLSSNCALVMDLSNLEPAS